MSKLERRIAKLRENPQGASCDEVISIILSLGFVLRGKPTGSHRLYKHPDHPELILGIPIQYPLKSVYAKKALEIIDRLMELEENE